MDAWVIRVLGVLAKSARVKLARRALALSPTYKNQSAGALSGRLDAWVIRVLGVLAKSARVKLARRALALSPTYESGIASLRSQ